MLSDFINDSPEFRLKQSQLQLAREHAYEWRHYFALAISDRFTLEIDHKEQISRSMITINYKELAVLLTRQLQQLKQFRQQQNLAQESITVRQAQEKADLL